MRRTALLLAWLALVPALSTADEAEERTKTATPTYESPILSLLLLPANILIRLASVLTPGESSQPSRESRAADSRE